MSPRKLRRSTSRALYDICCDLLGPPLLKKTSWWWEWHLNRDLYIKVVHTPSEAERMLTTGGWCVGPVVPYEHNLNKHTLYTEEGRRAFKQAILVARLRGKRES